MQFDQPSRQYDTYFPVLTHPVSPRMKLRARWQQQSNDGNTSAIETDNSNNIVTSMMPPKVSPSIANIESKLEKRSVSSSSSNIVKERRMNVVDDAALQKSQKKSNTKSPEKSKKTTTTTTTTTTTKASNTNQKKTNYMSSQTFINGKPTYWDFGKKDKNFVKPESDRSTNEAATKIQKMMRGWWLRLQFKLAILQHRIDTQAERTKESVGRVKSRYQKQKFAINKKANKKVIESMQRESMQSDAARQSQEIIAYLRHENKKLREKNQKIREAAETLHIHNSRLEDATSKSDESYGILTDHAKQIKETHEKLNNVIPKYEKGIKSMKEAIEIRRQFCLSEHKIKVMYLKCIGTAVELMEQDCRQDDLVQQIVELCLSLEDVEHTIEPPADLLKTEHTDQSSDDSEDYDEYTIATFNEK